MKQPGFHVLCSWWAALAAFASAAPALAFAPRETQANQLAGKEFFQPELHLSSSNLGLQEALTRVANGGVWSRFLNDQGGDVQVYLDPRSGTPSSIVLHSPIIPGTGAGNRLTMADVDESLGQSLRSIDAGIVAGA